jgi:predicted nuclease of restriction endonuclease-like (RecB) superfamily
MRAFAEAYPDEQFVQQVAAQIPWFHNCVILDKVKDKIEREWYIRQTIQHGWNRTILVHQIESGNMLCAISINPFFAGAGLQPAPPGAGVTF